MHNKTVENHIFEPGDLDLGPMTLTSKLGQELVTGIPHTKFCDPRSNGSVVRALTYRHTHAHIHTQTYGTDFIPSTTDAAGNDF